MGGGYLRNKTRTGRQDCPLTSTHVKTALPYLCGFFTFKGDKNEN